MDGLSKNFWTVLALESTWVLLLIYSLFQGMPKGDSSSEGALIGLLMIGGFALAIGLVAFLYLGGIALWFYFRHPVFALAALALPVSFIMLSCGRSR